MRKFEVVRLKTAGVIHTLLYIGQTCLIINFSSNEEKNC